MSYKFIINYDAINSTNINLRFNLVGNQWKIFGNKRSLKIIQIL